MGNETEKWVTRHSARGHAYQELDVPVPRLPDGVLEGIVYLYSPSAPDAENDSRLGGSGFLVMLPTASDRLLVKGFCLPSLMPMSLKAEALSFD